MHHSLRKQTFEIEAASEQLAMALQSSLGDINRRSLVPVIERVLNEVSIPGQTIKISKIKVDLGTIPFQQLEETAARRLYQELLQALTDAIAELTQNPTPENRTRPKTESLLGQIEHFLVQGTLPFGSTGAGQFSLERQVLHLAETNPQGLVELVKTHSHQRYVIERLLYQLGETALRRLLFLLEPEHAALILAYMVNLQAVHEIEPVLALSTKQFSHLLWVLVLGYLAQEHGSQFNRKSFVKSVLEGMAESEGFNFLHILITLHFGLQQTEKALSPKTSLPAVIGELIHEFQANIQSMLESAPPQSIPPEAITYFHLGLSKKLSTSGEEAVEIKPEPVLDQGQNQDIWQLVESYLVYGTLPFGTRPEPPVSFELLVLKLAETLPQRFVTLIQTQGQHRQILERLVLRLDEAALRRILQLLEPEHAALILAYLLNLREVHRVQPVLPLSDLQFSNLLWLLVLSYLVQERGSQFNRKTFVKTLLEGMSEREGLDFLQILTTLSLGLQETEKMLSPRSSLPAIIRELVNDFQKDEVHQPVAGLTRPALETRGEAGTQRGWFNRYDWMDAVRYFLKYGVLPWSERLRNPNVTLAEVFQSLTRLTALQIRQVLQVFPGEPVAGIRHLVEHLTEAQVVQLIRILLPQLQQADHPLAESLAFFAGQTSDKTTFYSRLLIAVLENQPLDFEQFASDETTSFHQPSPATKLHHWPPHQLKSQIASWLSAGDVEPDPRFPLVDLFEALLRFHPGQAGHFLEELQRIPGFGEKIAHRCTGDDGVRLVEFFHPEQSTTLNLWLRIFTRIPASIWPLPQTQRMQVFLGQVLVLKKGTPLTRAFFVRLLRRLFGFPLPLEVVQFFLDELDTLGSKGKMPAAVVVAFREALTLVNEGDQVSDILPAMFEPATPASVEALQFQIAVQTYLLGEEFPTEFASASPQADFQPMERDELHHRALVFLEKFPEAAHSAVSHHLSSPEKREYWVKSLPESALVRLVYLFEPVQCRSLIDAAEVLFSAWIEVAPPNSPMLSGRSLFWRFLLEFLAETTGSTRSVKRMVTMYFKFFARQLFATIPGSVESISVGRELLNQARHRATIKGHAGLRAIFQTDEKLLLTIWEAALGAGDTQDRPEPEPEPKPASTQPPTSTRKIRGKTAFGLPTTSEVIAIGEPVYISNAGLVLTAPFLPFLFQNLDLLTQDDKGKMSFRDAEAITRGVHLLQYLVDGSTATPEPLLVLNKILCGVPVPTPIEQTYTPTEKELEMCDTLLKSIIANWKIISNTSVAGLQETFLRREGKLERAADRWTLHIQRKTVDILVDQLPWGISVVFHRWMEQPVYVTW